MVRTIQYEGMKQTTKRATSSETTKRATSSEPTIEQFAAYQSMYDYFNRELFAGGLKPVILNFSRMANTYGFFAPKRWGRLKDGSGTHEISLNPSHLGNRTLRDVAATLVHEMVHCWQQEHGEPGRGRYHNSQWASKMEDVGLMPSDTGAPGGGKVGDRVSHYVIDGGPFDRAYNKMPGNYQLPWTSFDAPKSDKKRAASKVKYTCAGCDANAWGKPGLNINCGDCDETMEPAESTD